MLNRKVRAIVRREYLQRIRSRWFIIGTLVVPALMIAITVGPILFLDTGGDKVDLVIGVVDETGELGPGLVSDLVEGGIAARTLEAVPDVAPDSLAAALQDSTIDAVLVVPRDALGGARLELRTAAEVSRSERDIIEDAVVRDVTRARLRAAGVEEVNTELLLRRPAVDIVRLDTAPGRRSDDAAEAIGLVFGMLLYTMLLIYGQMVIRGVMEEKTSDIVEVMVSSVRAWELMAGKIIGVGAVGLTQFAIWGIIGVVLAAYGLSAAAPALAQAGIDLSGISVPFGMIVSALVFFLLGYLLYAGLFAAGGAMVSSDSDVQQVMMPIVILIIIPIIALGPVMDDPGQLFSVVLSLIPFFSPILMMTRMAVIDVPAWQLAVAVLLLVLTIMAVTWVAGRIYRIGILMRGKPPNLPELVRWIRHG